MLTERQEKYVDGLHNLADFLSDHPEFIESYGGVGVWIDVDDPEEFRTMLKNARGRWEKSSTDYEFNVSRHFNMHSVNLYINREKVCKKVVTGTKIIKVPDPTRPLIEKEVETYEWECNPLLAGPEVALPPLVGVYDDSDQPQKITEDS